jgi:fructosamine-3-kinase
MANSKLFKDLHQTEISKVIINLYGSATKIEDCILMKGGVFNTTYWVKTNSDVNGIVLRVAPINQHLLFDFEKSMMSAEPLFYELLQKKNIPSSEVIQYDNSFKVIDREYIIFKYIPSIPMNDSSVPGEIKPGLYQELGALISSLHDIRCEKFGWKRPNNELELYDNWGAFLIRFAKEMSDKAAKYGVFRENEINRFLKVFDDSTIFNQITQARMFHADLWEGNVLVRKSNDKWQVAAIIDIDKAIFGDHEMEFASPIMLNEDFLKGYGKKLGDSTASKYRRKVYNLLGSFMYAYIWLVQYEDKEKYLISKQMGLDMLDLIESS